MDIRLLTYLQKKLKFSPFSEKSQVWLVRIILWFGIVNAVFAIPYPVSDDVVAHMSLAILCFIYALVLNHEDEDETDFGIDIND